MATPVVRVVTSTADLTPDGVGGYVKAIWAGLAAGLAAAGTALADGTVTTLEWVGIITAVVLAAGGTYGLANTVKPVGVVKLPIESPEPPEPYLDDLGS